MDSECADLAPKWPPNKATKKSVSKDIIGTESGNDLWFGKICFFQNVVPTEGRTSMASTRRRGETELDLAIRPGGFPGVWRRESSPVILLFRTRTWGSRPGQDGGAGRGRKPTTEPIRRGRRLSRRVLPRGVDGPSSTSRPRSPKSFAGKPTPSSRGRSNPRSTSGIANQPQGQSPGAARLGSNPARLAGPSGEANADHPSCAATRTGPFSFTTALVFVS
jgi:hypothetical protein